MTIDDLIAQVRGKITAKLAERTTHEEALNAIRSACVTENRDPSDEESEQITTARAAKEAIDTELDGLRDKVAEYQRDKEADERAATLADESNPTGVRVPPYDGVARVGQEKRTYSPESDKSGRQFLLDVGRAFLGDWQAQQRLARHNQEERIERPDYDWGERAAGTGAFAGLVVPQYLTDMYAPSAKANRPFADACNGHDLPADGMTVNLSQITTGTSAAEQTTQNTGVSETNIDDTLLTINVKTNAGQQTLSRQAIERGSGVEGAMLDDLFRAYATSLDSKLINDGTIGLTTVATSVAYTDATPTVAELYPKFLAALAAVEAALLDQDPADNIAVMHSRRWYWLNNAMGSTWPIMAQPGIAPQMTMTNLVEAYGRGVRGILPNGTPVIVDNNISTALGAGTEDEIYIGSRRECHLWEDPSAPMLIRAEQPAAASLGVLFVVYGYYAFTATRYAHVQKIAGTGLIAPAFTGA